MVKALTTTCLILLSAMTVVAVDASLQYFNAKSAGSNINLEWKSGAEGDLTYYEIERASDDQVFRYVATVNAKGSSQSYTYVDDEAFSKRDGTDGKVSSSYFTYRLKMTHSDKSVSYSNTSGVAHNVSSVRRTWGMIKEMFR